jgi:hypothetical protein
MNFKKCVGKYTEESIDQQQWGRLKGNFKKKEHTHVEKKNLHLSCINISFTWRPKFIINFFFAVIRGYICNTL